MKYSIILVLALLAGCSTTSYPESQEAPETVKVPVSEECPAIKDLSEGELKQPEIPVDKLNNNSSAKEVARAYAKSIEIQEAKIEELINIIESCELDQN